MAHTKFDSILGELRDEDDGQVGATGPAGSPGGATGPQGFTGATGSGFTGSTGPMGPSGAGLPALSSDPAPQLSGNLNSNGNQIINTVFKQVMEVVNHLGTITGPALIDLAKGNVVTATVASTGPRWSVTGVGPTGSSTTFSLILTNGGAQSGAWMTGAKFAGGTYPALTASGEDLLGFNTIDGGVNWRIVVAGADFK